MLISGFSLDCERLPAPLPIWRATVRAETWAVVARGVSAQAGRLVALWASDRTRGASGGFAVSAAYAPVSYTHLDVYKRQVHRSETSAVFAPATARLATRYPRHADPHRRASRCRQQERPGCLQSDRRPVRRKERRSWSATGKDVRRHAPAPSHRQPIFERQSQGHSTRFRREWPRHRKRPAISSRGYSSHTTPTTHPPVQVQPRRAQSGRNDTGQRVSDGSVAARQSADTASALPIRSANRCRQREQWRNGKAWRHSSGNACNAS